MYRVLDVLKPEVGRSWLEVVAIVQEVASQLAPGSAVPGSDDLLLDDDGTLRLGFGPDTQENPVSGLGTLLQTLLTGIDAPPGLRELAVTNATPTPAHSSVDSFQRGLGFYERPGRANELRAVAARLASHANQVGPEEEFERLREKVTARAEEKPKAEKTNRRFSRKALFIAAAVELAVLGAIVVYARPQYFRSAGSVGDRIEQGLADTISTGLNKLPVGNAALSAPVQAEAPAPAESGSSEPAAPAKMVGTSARNAGRTPTPILLPDGTPAPISPTEAARLALPPVSASEPEPVARSMAGPASSDLAGFATYTSSDHDVQPPRLSRQQLPREPEPGSDTGYFDMTINEQGFVEQLKLISPVRRFQERMLMSAAKAWKFKPAVRNGQPVRYRMRIAIILPG